MALGEAFESVLCAAQGGGEWAFARLYEEYNPRLLRYFAARAPAAAEDLAAETWIGAARGLRSFVGDETRFRSWLFTIAHRRTVDHWAAQRQAPSDPVPITELDAYLAPDDPEGAVLDAHAARAAVQRIASILPPDQVDVVLLRLLGGLSVDQVAEVLGKRPGTVRVLQHRALRRLAKEISLEDVTG
jgi:RNA polymerase sigma-70 factor (ECF subfamily)